MPISGGEVTDTNHEALKGKVVVVVGGGGLLGRNFCQTIVCAGSHVVVADRDDVAAGHVAEKLNTDGGSASFAKIDITNRASVDLLISQTLERHGRIDGVVNSAYPRNASYGRKLEDVAYEDFFDNVGVHLGGYFLVAQRFALHFRESGGGSIVNIASVYGFLAPRFDLYIGTSMTVPVEYAAIKAGIIQLTRYLAQYFKRDGVRVNAVSPGGVRDRQPEAFLDRYDSYSGSKGMLDPQDVSGGVVFLLSNAAQYITGQNLVIDDGFSL